MISTSRRETEARPFHTPIGELSARWWLCQTVASREKSLAKSLYEAGCDYFLPMNRVRRRVPWSNHAGASAERTVIETKPLFPGYVFLNGDSARDTAASWPASEYQVGIIPVVNQPKLQGELESIAKALGSDPFLGAVRGLKKGTWVTIIHGAFQGCIGIVDHEICGRVFLNCELMGSCIEVQVDPNFVEPY